MESKEVIIYSGNILNKAVSLPKGNESSNDDELFESLKVCVAQTEKKAEEPLNGNVFEVFAEDDLNSISSQGDRQDLKVTSKLFLYSLERKDIIAAVDRGLRCTSVEYLDNIVLSFSSFTNKQECPLTLEHIQKAWIVLEELVSSGKVKMIGLSDVDTQLFINLYQLAKVKPGIVQINLASCCVVPPELAEFCKLNGIQLLTHKDSLNVLPEEKVDELGKLVNQNCFVESSSASRWAPIWVMRFQVHLKTRGVLATKGYVASFSSSDVIP